MIFKSFSSISRHAALAKHLWQGNGSSQPAGAFFISTNQLARHQSQIARRRSENSTANNNSSSQQSLSSIVSFPGLSQFATLDEDKQLNVVENSGSSSLYRTTSKQQQQQQQQPILLSGPGTASLSIRTRSQSRISKRPSRGALKRHYSTSAANISEKQIAESEQRRGLVENSKVELGGVTVEEDVFIDEPEDIPLLNLSSASEIPPLDLSADQDVESNIESSASLGSPRTTGSSNPSSVAGATSRQDDLNAEIALYKSKKNVDAVLDLYSQLLGEGLAPDTQTYQNVILCLTESAHIPIDSHYKLLRRRHLDHLSEIVGADAQALDQYELAESYAALALDIFEASNSFEQRVYDRVVYESLAQVCSRFRSLAKRNVNLPNEFLLRVHATNGNVQEVEKLDGGNQTSLLEATLQSGDISRAVQLLKSILHTTSDAQLADAKFEAKVIGPMIVSMARFGQSVDSWRWIQQVDADPRVARLSFNTLSDAFSRVVENGHVNVASAMFDFIASQQDVPCSVLNDVRSDFAMLCVRSDSDLVYKAIQESQLRDGVWDATTAVLVSRHLISKSDVATACDVALMHIVRSVETDTTPVFDALVVSLAQNNLLSPSLCLQLYSVFGRQDSSSLMLDTLVKSNEFNHDTAVVELFCQKIEQLPYSEMLGELCLSAEELAQLKTSFATCVRAANIDNTELSARVQNCVARLGGDISMFQPVDAAVEDPFAGASGQIIAYARTEYGLSQAYELLTDAVTRGSPVSADAYLHVLDTCYKEKSIELSRSVYGLLLQHFDKTNFDAALNGVIQLSAKHDPETAHAAFSHLVNTGSMSWNLVEANTFTALVKYNIVNEMEAYTEAMRYNRVDKHLVSAVISQLCKNGQVDKAHELFTSNNARDSHSMTSLIKAYCKLGQTQEAEALINQLDSSFNKTIVYNMLLRSHVYVTKDKQKALDVVAFMRSNGIEFTPHTYTLEISSYGLSPSAADDIDNADKVLLRLAQDKVKAEGHHFAALVRLRGVAKRDFNAAVEFYQACTQNRRIRPDLYMFTALVETYVVNNQVAGTPNVLRDMVQHGVDMDTAIANLLISGWGHENFDKAAGLFEYAVQTGLADVASYSEIVKSALLHGHVDAATSFVNLMIANGFPVQYVRPLQQTVALYTGASSNMALSTSNDINPTNDI